MRNLLGIATVNALAAVKIHSNAGASRQLSADPLPHGRVAAVIQRGTRWWLQVTDLDGRLVALVPIGAWPARTRSDPDVHPLSWSPDRRRLVVSFSGAAARGKCHG